jgi:hypothetical protein
MNADLVVNERVRDDEETGLEETLLGVVRERAGGVAATDVVAARALGELEHGTLAIRTSAHRDDVVL